MSAPQIIDTGRDLNALFTAQAKATPSAVALQDISQSYTYSELDAKVSDLALHLRRSHSVGRDVLVGVLLERCSDYVVACLAALRAGGAFLVLELAYPPTLLQDVIEDAQPAVILTHTSHAKLIRAEVPTISLDDASFQQKLSSTGSAEGDADLPPLPAQDDLERLAFVSYSSGTTGKPK